MAENEDPFASIIDDCLYSSSQEELLTHSKFAREDETFVDNVGESLPAVDSGQAQIQSDGTDATGRSNQAELTCVRPDCNENKFQGFPEGSKGSTIDVVFGGEVRASDVPESVKSRVCMEPPLRKSRVSDSKSPILKGEKVRVSPLVQCCSEKMTVDSEDKNKPIEVSVEIVRPLRCFSPDGVECSVKQLVEGGKHATRNRIRRQRKSAAKRMFEFEGTMEGVEVEEEQTTEPKNEEVANDVCKEDGNGNGAENRREEIEAREKLEKWVGKMLGSSGKGSDGIGNGGFGAQNKEQGQTSNEENGGRKSKTDDTSVKNLLESLKMLASQMFCDDEDGEVDILETAKKHGMTFPRNRFLVNSKKDE